MQKKLKNQKINEPLKNDLANNKKEKIICDQLF